jgi:hypothetical protein
VLKRVGAVAYRLELPEEMSDIHPVFHISQLRRCLKVLEEKRVPMETIDLQPDLRYQEVPVKILDTMASGQGRQKYGCAESNGADTEWKKPRGNERTH